MPVLAVGWRPKLCSARPGPALGQRAPKDFTPRRLGMRWRETVANTWIATARASGAPNQGARRRGSALAWHRLMIPGHGRIAACRRIGVEAPWNHVAAMDMRRQGGDTVSICSVASGQSMPVWKGLGHGLAWGEQTCASAAAVRGGRGRWRGPGVEAERITAHIVSLRELPLSIVAVSHEPWAASLATVVCDNR